MADNRRAITIRAVILATLFVVAVPALPLLVTLRWEWWEAWAYFALCVVSFVLSRTLAARRDPGILAERAKFTSHADAKPWDRTLSPLVGLGGGMIPLTAGLDARFGWSAATGLGELSMWVRLSALALVAGGYAFSSWALVENRFFSGMVRIQKDRGHAVVSTGPYAVVRHPGYAGGLLAYLVTPLLLESAWAFVPVGVLCGVLVVRTGLEDRTLREELPGYVDYTRKTRFRLIPGVW